MTSAVIPTAKVTGRGGLTRAPAKVAYLGASVTRQQDGYRPRLHELLERRLGHPLEQVAAGFGAMDSVSIVFLTDAFVTSHRPDLCFVDVTSGELAEERSVEEAQAALDGIFAKLRLVNCAPCLLHLPRHAYSDRFETLLEGYESVAELHAVPSVDLATPFRQAVAAGELDDGELIRDTVHTTGAGSTAYAEAIDTTVGELLATGAEGTAELPVEPATSFRDARLLAADPADGGEPGRFRTVQPFLCVAEGSSIRRTFEGSLEGLALVAGPEAGEIEVTDSHGSQLVMVWDEWSHYERYGVKLFPRGLEPGEVTITPTGGRPDYSRSRAPMDPPDRTMLKLIGYLERP